jgi:hypothetical protein
MALTLQLPMPMTLSTADRSPRSMTSRTLAALALLGCTLPAAAQQTFDFDQELSNSDPDSKVGWALDLSSDGLTVVFGAVGYSNEQGQIKAYRNISYPPFDTWIWTLMGDPLTGTADGQEAGHDVSISNDGNTIAYGIPGLNRARVYDWNGSDAWEQRGNGFILGSSQPQQRAGHSICLNGVADRIAVGDPLERRVWLFALPSVGSGGTAGNLMSGALILPGTYAGGSLDLNDAGTSVVVGAYKANTERGEVYVYDVVGTNWVQRGATLTGLNNYDHFGFDVNMSNDGNTIAIGSKGWDGVADNTTTEVGRVLIYDWDGSAWVQRGSSINGQSAMDECGYAVSLSGNGDRIAVGYRGESVGNLIIPGAVRIFDWNGSDWAQNGDLIAGMEHVAQAGHSVGLNDDGTVLGIGAITDSPPSDGFTTDQGTVRIYQGSCYGGASTQTVASCEPYTWIDGTTYTASNNTAAVVLEGAAGCDSIVNLDLTITLVNASIAQSGFQLSATNTNATYQWVDCANGNAPINGATAQTYSVTSNGSYAVEVTENGCTSLSECVSIVNVGVPDTAAEQFGLFPNPVQDQLQISTSRTVERLDLFDLTGKYLIGNSIQNSLELAAISSGTYLVRVTFTGGEAYFARIQKL